MKKYLIGAFALGFASAAAGTDIHSQQGGFLGVKAGVMQVDVQDGTGIDLDNSTNLGLYAGYVGENGLGFELEYTQPTSESDTGLPSVTYELRTMAVYGTFRSEGNIYLKGKAGYLRENIKISGPGGSVSENETGLSLGGGVGFMLGNSRLELEYTIIESDVNYLSVGFIF